MSWLAFGAGPGPHLYYPMRDGVANKPKQKGTQAESDVVRWAKKHEFYAAERLALSGVNDRGDVRIATGVMVQVKDGYTDRKEPTDFQIDSWLKETEQQRIRGDFTVGLLVHKRFGKGDPDEWRWYLDKRNALVLLGVVALQGPGGPWGAWPQYIQLQGYMVAPLIRTFLVANRKGEE